MWAIRNHGPLLQHKDKDGWTPLYEAIRQKNHEFVELVIAHACDVRGLLGAANKGQNCLHLAISERSPLTRTIISEIQRSDERKSPFSTGAGGGVNRARHVQNSTDAGGFFTMHGLDDKMTPLHLAADMEQYDSDDKPYQFGRDAALPSRTLTNHIKSEVPPNRIIRRATGGAETPSRDPNPRPEDARLAATLGDETSWTPSNGVFPSQTADRAVARDDNSTTIHLNGAPTGTPTATKGPQSFDLVDIVQRLVAASRRVLVDYVDKDGKTPFQLRLETLQDEDPEERRCSIINDDSILLFMREYIVSTFDRKDALKALYRVGDGEKPHHLSLAEQTQTDATSGAHARGKQLPRLAPRDDPKREPSSLISRGCRISRSTHTF